MYDSKQLEQLRGKLGLLKQNLESSLEAENEAVKPVDLNQPIGRLTRMDAMQQQSMAKAGLAAQKKQLAAIKLALKDIEEGVYGQCASCGELIPFARLLAKPEAKLCVECKGSQE